jgi:hypothetical protein
MIMNSPIGAMLWENWRLSRIEAGWRLGLGLVGGAAALTFLDARASAAFLILIVLNSMFWLSISKLNGGRFSDGYKPGFPFYLLYRRPVSTPVFVVVAMMYDAIGCLALYLVSAALLNFAFDTHIPLFSVSLWMLAFHLVCTCVQWATRNRVVQWTGSMVFGWPLYFLLKQATTPALQVEFSLVENVLLVVICVLSLVLAVIGIARQRRGDAIASAPRAADSTAGYPVWLVSLFRFQCPISSAMRAQVWFELRSNGLPVLTIGLSVAALISLLFALGIAIAPVRSIAVGIAALSIPVLMITLGGNAFGIRQKQGRRYTSAFEATQPAGSAQLAGIKVLVRASCVLVALITIGACMWICSSFLTVWGTWTPEGQDMVPGLLQARQKVAGVLAGLTGSSYAALAIAAPITIAAIVAWLATREALRARYPRFLFIAQAVPMVWSIAIIALTLALRGGFGPVALVGEIVKVTFWITGAAMVVATLYLLWSGFMERVLTMRYVCGALALAAAFAVAWIAGTTSTAFVIEKLWLALMILMLGLLAPWSLNRVRHL